ncbi:ABC-2 family transporter protein [Tsuneonella dongtanensis]|uniref:ABC-2 family transporter protein n=1 Tax=Tsuneonella dongtanensis TaxID=692370 RepID=A0A1B2A9Y0_9SPHN|nr:ABC transporter permease [Tsuneonella dongtanensis]ANY18911.1 ABC-2 family transporter protein [Tsuneonella dongtanensis]
MSTETHIAPMSRLPLVTAAFVIARRDFTAILFSKAFLFFLLGPVFFGLISVGAASVGRKAAENSDPPVLAVMLAPEAAGAIEAAHARVSPLVDLPAIEVVPAGEATSPEAVLRESGRNYGAVLSGTLAQPRLTGTSERIGRWQGPVSLLAASALDTPGPYPPVALSPTASSQSTVKRARTGTATASVTLMFLLTMLLAGMVMSNLVEEKANKIIEILAAAIPMDAVFVGKLFAMLAVSFVGLAVWGGVGLLGILAGQAQLGSFPVPAVGWPTFIALFLVYFAMAYLLIGSIFLTIGAMAPTVRDVQTLSMPATMLQLGVFFLATYATSDLGSPVEMSALAFPLSSPYAMVSRAAQEAAIWPHLLALSWQALWVALFVRFGAQLFRRRVMKSGPHQPRAKGFLKRMRPARAKANA